MTRWIREGKLAAERPHPNKRYAKVTAEQIEEAAKRGTIAALTAGWLNPTRARSRSDIGNESASTREAKAIGRPTRQAKDPPERIP